jgi:hypothetical protein
MISIPIKPSGGSAQASKPANESCGPVSGLVAKWRYADLLQAAAFPLRGLVLTSAGMVPSISSLPAKSTGKYVPPIAIPKLNTRHRPKSRCNDRLGTRPIWRRSSHSWRRPPSPCTIEQQDVDLSRRIVRPPWHPERGVMVVTAARALEPRSPRRGHRRYAACHRAVEVACSASPSSPLRIRRNPRD